MNRFRARASSALLVLFALLAVGGAGQAQDRTPSFWFAGTRLIFDRAVPLDGDVAVATGDAGLARFLARLGATVSYQPKQRYVVVTAADHRTIAFTLGTAQYTVGGLGARAAFAPFADGNDAIVPLYAVARALFVEPVADGADTVLQAQIGALDVRTDGRRTVVLIRGATQLAYVKRIDTPERVELAFSGVGSALAGMHPTGALSSVTVTSGGPAKNPTTVIGLDAPRGTTHEVLAPGSPFELGLAFTAAGAPVAAAPTTPLPSPALVAVPPPMASPTPAPPFAAPLSTPPPIPPVGDAGATTAPPAHAVVTGVVLQPQGDDLQLRITVSGSATYEWHRLADQRWYVDVQNAILTDAGRDERPPVAAVDSVRIRQTGTADAPAVRIALTLRGDRRVDVTPLPDGLSILAANVDAVAAARSGTGRIGGAFALLPPETSPSPADLAPVDEPTPWKFGPTVPGSRIIVIDPGHGGDDHGTEHNGLSEKIITLDIARRLRTILSAQGWTVRLTRDADIDPVSTENLALMRADGKPNPEDRAYLQTRTDVANTVNARMFISIHVNYSPSSGVNGTTFYWYKPQDLALAQAMERAVIATANTNDVGTRHENLYVVRHATMPAVLIETAFISNPGDANLLRSPAFLQNIAQGIANGVKAYAGAAPVQASQVDR